MLRDHKTKRMEAKHKGLEKFCKKVLRECNFVIILHKQRIKLRS